MCETLFGLSKADSGQVVLNGKKVSFSNSSEAVKEGFAFVPESRQTEGLVLENNVEENITINILDQLVGKLSIVDKKQRSEKAKEYINMLNVKPPYPEMQVSKLSGGNQQKIVIAKWVATHPRVMVIDEPTNGVDVGAKQDIHNILRELAAQGIGVIMISSDLPEILAVSDRILVMRRGHIVAEFNGDDATQELIMNEAIL